MVIVDTALAKAHAAGKPVRVGLVGAGYSAKRIAHQVLNAVNGIDVVAIANRTIDHAAEAFRFAGAGEFRQVDTTANMDRLVRDGMRVITEDPAVLCESTWVDAVVDATGCVDYGARVALSAIENDKHLILQNVEMDATVGPILKHKAARRGLVYTNSDGDEPGVAMNMIRFVRSIGLEPVMAGNLKGLYDPYRTPETQAEFARSKAQKATTMTHFADGTKLSMELSVLGNAAGWGVAKRGMFGPSLNHVNDAPAYYKDKLRSGGMVDFLVGAAPSNGAFVLGRTTDKVRAEYLDYLKLGLGPLYCLYTPFHLPQLEIPNTIARAVLLDDATVAPKGAPTCDTIAVAKRDLKAGDVLDGIGGFHTYGLIENFAKSTESSLLPMGVSEGCRLTRNVTKDTAVTYSDVELPAGRVVDQLRTEQQSLFNRGWPSE